MKKYRSDHADKMRAANRESMRKKREKETGRKPSGPAILRKIKERPTTYDSLGRPIGRMYNEILAAHGIERPRLFGATKDEE